jgi:NAD(P)-dependent dehydrogenase (short-subunit alcohol dehydrogenase family)
MTERLEGKVTLITGGTSGIGRVAAVVFAKEGAKIAVSGRNSDEGEKTVAMVKEAGGECIFIKTDVSKTEEVQNMVNLTVQTYGRLDCAFNNAGVGPLYAPLADYPEEAWDNIINIDLKGVFLCMKYEIPQLLKNGKGTIVNNASTTSIVGLIHRGAYVAAKHGVVGLTKVAALDYATQSIRVNAVCPGWTQTPMIEAVWERDPAAKEWQQSLSPMSRHATSEEVAEAALWLLSDSSSFTTGHSLLVDGGWVVR